MSSLARAFGAAAAVLAAAPSLAQTTLPEIAITGSKPTKVARQPAANMPPGSDNSLTVPTAERARMDVQRTPGAVEVVPDTVFKNAPAQTVKDVVDWTPGVWAHP